MVPKFLQPVLQKYFSAGLLTGFVTLNRRTLENLLYGRAGSEYIIIHIVGEMYNNQEGYGFPVVHFNPKCRFGVDELRFTDYNDFLNELEQLRSGNVTNTQRYDHHCIQILTSGRTLK